MGRVGIRTVGLVANPRAGRGRASHANDRAVARLTERGVSVVAVRGRNTDATRRLLAGLVADDRIDSLVSERVNRMSWPPGRSRYHMAIAAELVHLRPMPFRITLDDGTVLDAPVTLAAFGNTRSYGGGMAICPSVDHSDGLLDLTVIGKASRVRAVRTLSKLFSGDHVMFDEVTVHRTRSARVEYLGVGGHCSYADGDAMATLPVTVEAVPAVGRYIVPRP